MMARYIINESRAPKLDRRASDILSRFLASHTAMVSLFTSPVIGII
jgi:hypothetical protein